MWGIIKSKNGVKRWKKISGQNKTRKIFKSKKNKITVKILKALRKKYNTTITGNKKEMAEGLWRIRGESMDNDDLEKNSSITSKKR